MLDRLIDAIQSLIPMSNLDPDVPVLDEAELAERINAGEELVILFYADWCGFCRAFLPTYEDDADQLPATAVAADISDYSDPRWEAFDVDTVPTLVVFEDGEEAVRIDGAAGRGLKREDLDRLTQRLAA